MTKIQTLQEYKSHKVTHAEPMNFDDYVTFSAFNSKLRSSKIDPTPESREGYHVVYDLGTDDECHSWCPKDKHEAGNSLTTEAAKFEAGDIVELKTGGPQMVISSIENEGKSCHVTWFAEGTCFTHRFLTPVLLKVHK